MRGGGVALCDDEVARQNNSIIREYARSATYFWMARWKQQPRAKPAFTKATGAEPETYVDIRKAMSNDPYFAFWSAMQRNSQEMMWKSVQIPVERQLPDLIAAAGKGGGPEFNPNCRP